MATPAKRGRQPSAASEAKKRQKEVNEMERRFYVEWVDEYLEVCGPREAPSAIAAISPRRHRAKWLGLHPGCPVAAPH